MGQTGSGADITKIGGFILLQLVTGDDLLSNQGPQGAADAGRLQAVGQTRADIIDFREGKYLCLILHTPECGGENDPVQVTLKIRTGSAGY